MESRYDKEEMKELIMGKEMPQDLLQRIPQALFGGKLAGNKLIRDACLHVEPPRLTILLAMYLKQGTMVRREIVYQASEYPWNLFLVRDGVFAYIAMPTPTGGRIHVKSLVTHKGSKLGQKARAPLGHAPGGATRSDAHSAVAAAPSTSSHISLSAHRTEEGYPFQLFAVGNYFGDIELFLQQPRIATVRCESTGGSVLMLHKNDLDKMLKEFPQFTSAWKLKAYHHASTLKRMQRQLQTGLDYRALAATAIQKNVKKRLLAGHRSATASNADTLATTKAATSFTSGAEKKVCLHSKLESLHSDVSMILEHLSAQNLGVKPLVPL